MRAEIIASGTELLLGESSDANTAFLAGQLALLGIDLYYTSIVGDNYERYTGVMRQAWNRSDLIITTGGLGPTRGDITREVIAGVAGEDMAVDDCLRKEIYDFFARRGMEMPENNLRQAILIPSATALHNIAGTAPGWWVEKDGRIIVTLPGPPAEMQAMWRSEVLLRLEARSGAIIISRTLKTWGISEAKIDQLVAPFLSCANPTLALYAKQDGIHLRITAKAVTRESAADLLSTRESDIRKVLKETIWGADQDSLEDVIGNVMLARNKKIAVVEALTGGLLSSLMAGSKDSSLYFCGGLILNSDEAMERFCIDSSQVKADGERAMELASGVRVFLQADIGLAVDGAWEIKDRELSCTLYVAINDGEVKKVLKEDYSGTRQQIIRRSVNYILVNLRNYLSN